MSIGAKPIDSEIPKDWFIEGGCDAFTPSYKSFTAQPNEIWPVIEIPIALVRPPNRNRRVERLNCERSISILKAFATGVPLPAIEVDEPPDLEDYLYRVRDGYHRFHLSVAVGYPRIPVSILPYFDINNC
ncbi:MAG: hypothetical protein H6978_00425 [Gammaproteobacteria bacterium]|nr:hypothetical protein [Gammaproteobacteria bacterium]